MRTTIEMRTEQRARLLELAAKRGQKGFSGLVQEAVNRFIAEEDHRENRTREALAVLGGLDESEAQALHDSVRSLRRS